jgi:hypothetical protein
MYTPAALVIATHESDRKGTSAAAWGGSANESAKVSSDEMGEGERGRGRGKANVAIDKGERGKSTGKSIGVEYRGIVEIGG